MKKLNNLNGHRIYLEKTTLSDWLSLREKRLTEELLKYEPPDRPVPSEEDDKSFFLDFVEPGDHLIFNICNEQKKIIGFIHAFSFNFKKRICETGILIFSQENRGRGYGAEVYEVFLKYLNSEYHMDATYILTHPDNLKAKSLYEKLGYKDLGVVEDGPDIWQCMEYRF